MPDVSIIIAAWRAEDSIADAIASALAQDVDLEVIVVDDASPDGTAAAAQAVADPRVQVLRLTDNGGPAVARNAGFAAARGTFLAVLDADDAFEPGRLSRCLAAARGADIVVDTIVIEDDGKRRALNPVAAVGRPTLDLADYVRLNCPMARKDTLGYTKPLFRRAFLSAHGLSYDPSLRIGEDYMLMAEALARGARCVLVEPPGYLYRRHDRSISARLGAHHIEAMLAADVAFTRRHHLPANVGAAIAVRRAALRDALAFAQAVDALKARRPFAATAAVARRPRSAIHFRYPVGVRLARLWRPARPQPAG